jgi:hypothetical protein
MVMDGSIYAPTSRYPAGLRLAELLGALSHALDMTRGRPRALRTLLPDRHARRAGIGPSDTKALGASAQRFRRCLEC